MTVETVTYISDFNSTYPAGADAKSEGDDHIRRIKAGIKATFPNITGVVSASHTELNLIVGRTNFEFPSGTALLFYQASAPTGWVTAVLGSRYMVCATDAGGDAGGSDNPISWNSAHTHDVSGTTGAGSSHTHSLTTGSVDPGTGQSGVTYGNITGAESSHTHTFSDTSTSAGGTFTPIYLDCVIGTKS